MNSRSSGGGRWWTGSVWAQARTKLAPQFPSPVVSTVDVGVVCQLEAATPAVDFEFPQFDLDELEIELLDSETSPDLASFETAPPEDIDPARLFGEVEISENLFIPLRRVSSGGRAYDRATVTGEIPANEPLLARAPSKDKDGYRKSFTEIKDPSGATRRVLSIWDLLLPILEPPLVFDLPDSVTLPDPLYAFQIDGVRFLVEREGALLGDDMGTGKTVQSIVAMRILFQRGDVRSALIVVPLALLRNWDRELEKWAPTLSGVTVVRGPKELRRVQWERPAHVWIATYGVVRSDIEEIREHHSFDLVVLDEIQAIKNRTAQQARAAKRLPRARSWGLSGTPIENSVDDLCSIYGFLSPGLLPAEGVDPFAARSAIEPHFLRRRKMDVLKDLPEKHAFDEWLLLEGEQRRAYERAEHEGRVWLSELGTEVTVQHVLKLLQRLKMLCNRDPKSGTSAKLLLLEERVEELVSQGAKALVFSQYLAEGVEPITERLSAFRPVVITGAVSAGNRDRAVQAFQNDPECKLLVATPKSGGVGLNLVAGNYVFHFDHWWNPATVRQAEDRAHRIGQTKDVFVYHFWTENTIEERIYGILERKKRLYADVIDALSNVESSGLSEAELFEIFDLKPGRQRRATRKTGSYTWSVEQLLELSPEEFEDVVARLYQAWGYGTRVTPSSHDHGIDVVATRSTPGGGLEKVGVQCKRYASTITVGRPDAQKLLGAISSDPSYSKGVLATTSGFSAECRRFASPLGNIELIDGSRLCELLRRAGVPPS